jgi:hypothetical protein
MEKAKSTYFCRTCGNFVPEKDYIFQVSKCKTCVDVKIKVLKKKKKNDRKHILNIKIR